MADRIIQIVKFFVFILIVGLILYFGYNFISSMFTGKMANTQQNSQGAQNSLDGDKQAMLPMKDLKIQLRGGREYNFRVEIASSDADRERGLMFRTNLPSNQGMLFIFDEIVIQRFWMKNTLIPLDMIFLDSAGKVVSLTKNALPCAQEPCRVYSSKVPVRYVLELNAGLANEMKLKNGDEVSW